jgi:hypothetical protein
MKRQLLTLLASFVLAQGFVSTTYAWDGVSVPGNVNVEHLNHSPHSSYALPENLPHVINKGMHVGRGYGNNPIPATPAPLPFHQKL